MSNQSRVARTIEALAEPVAASLGLSLVQVVYQREPEGWVLRLLVERRAGGLTVEDCRLLSRELSDLFDVEDPIPGAYRLEVSSPGLDRPLVRPEDFERFAGRKISLRTDRPVSERHNFKGTLVGLQDGRVLIEADGIRHEIEHAWIAKANLVPEIEGFPARTGNC